MTIIQTAEKARHHRSVHAIFKGLMNPQNISAVAKILGQCNRPIDFLRRYLSLGGGEYPVSYVISTPTGKAKVTAFNADDVITINEVFFRGDYGDSRKKEVIVDFGSNVGISAIYFLTRHSGNFVYCFEPLPQNIERLKKNLKAFEGHFELNPVAVGYANGTVEFGWEPSGRYGGIGQPLADKMTVQCVDSNKALERVIKKHSRIDLLKIDIEMLEREITERIPMELSRLIERIAIEWHFVNNPLPATHEMAWRRPITTLVRLPTL
ncbi:MAG: FkbM family methyltransferase [Mesorhizobium sp.]|uniref:FkbM family methyltransferase n=1 Tax=Mesorhizobium TaxID=68287 RepID=UPI000FE38A79|nr:MULTISPECIES: FkbM family methyltransferase [Mesorhizobium]MCF6118170.1 FkbM family methyltransferase [Mesorhizobium muleiense]RWB07691.1 MAG: FkbM family methyltransferase [Mesorhizobium sp.]RWB97766.1 MAG: FkbM family methyltransferase [Mesorhizobium sp.]RWO13699.1 MAG: FkbM family methyltransferase [Mesorhizobium sp.]RWO33861.1 MAG: FkbM family methyltransferase [Mesorhizobium sp.]